MNIRPKIPMLLGGNNIWYNGILDYDPTRYVHAYDTSRLVNPLNFGEAWASRTNGLGRGRYVPNPKFTPDYIKNKIENNNYYIQFTKDLFNPDGTLSNVGKAYAKLSDDLLPENSLARVYSENLMRNNWTTTNNDTLGRPGNSFNDVKNYLTYERNDNLPGGRHNVFLNKGKRYFYVDNEGKYHWISPEDATKYNISEKPVEEGWGEKDNVYWEDYEVTGPKLNDDQKETSTGSIRVRRIGNDEKPNFLQGLATKLRNAAPDILEGLRLGLNLRNNLRVFDTINNSIKPALLLGYNTHRQIVGDEATKQAYYKRAALGQTQAAKAFTSDADRQMAYLFEAKRIGDELRSQGDLADNLEIRRTSDESNQHQWSNLERNNRVANSNYLALLDAQAKKANLQALKYSADTSNWDNYLMGILNKLVLKKAKNLAILDLIWALTELNNLETNQEYLQLLKDADDAWNKALKEGNSPSSDENVKTALLKLRDWKTKYLILMLLSRPYSAKSGTKVTYKKKDDLLYKTTRDVVEHFRKMSKMTDDSRIRSKEKPIKLNSYPKSKKARRYLQGGVAPFTIFRPLTLGGENTVSTLTGTSSNNKSSSDNGKDLLDMIKELFKAVQGQGLPIDVNVVYLNMSNLLAKSKAFGTELSTEDIASMYLLSMYQINNLKYSKEVYDKAKAYATLNDSLNEFAVNALGHYIVLDTETGKLSTEKTWKDVLESGKNPITNLLLLNLRAYSPDLVSLKGDSIIENVINNGMGINKIGALIKALAGNIGSYDGKIEGLTQVESNRVKSGLLLLANAPDGYYKHTIEDKNLQTQIKAAISYITNMLSPSQRAILNAHGGADKLIPLFLASQENVTHNVTISPLTGKASDKGLGSGEKGDISSNPLLAIQREIGGIYLNYSLVTKDSNTKLSVNGTFYSLLPKISEDMSIDKMLSVSGIGGIIQGKRGITFGNLEIKPEDLKHIMYSNNGGMVVTLPCKIVNGIKLVNLDVVETYEKAEQKALQVNSDRNSPQFIQALALELKNEHLDSLLNSNGLPNKNMFGQFLVVEAYTSDKTKFDINSKYVEKIENPDEELELRMSKALSTDNKKSDYALDVKDHWTIFEGTWDDIYKGTVFIPLNNNPNAALNTWGNSAKIGQTTELEELYLISNKSSNFNGNNTLE